MTASPVAVAGTGCLFLHRPSRYNTKINSLRSSGERSGENWCHVLVSASAQAILDRMRDIFACNKCNSIYEITRRREKPLVPPRCQVCFESLPPRELGDWLAYERAEPETTLGEWLGVQTSQFSLPTLRQAFIELAQRELRSADPALPSSQLPKLSSFGSPRALDEQ